MREAYTNNYLVSSTITEDEIEKTIYTPLKLQNTGPNALHKILNYTYETGHYYDQWFQSTLFFYPTMPTQRYVTIRQNIF